MFGPYIGEEDAYVRWELPRSGYDVKLAEEVRGWLMSGLLNWIIEPHFFAGFSGGPKLVAPEVASGDTIMNLHSAELIGHPRSVWGVVLGEKAIRFLRRCWRLPDVSSRLQPEYYPEPQAWGSTRVFAGDLEEAHQVGIDFCPEDRDAGSPEPGDMVTLPPNSGYPLDRNLYQTVKACLLQPRIVEKRGRVIIAFRGRVQR